MPRLLDHGVTPPLPLPESVDARLTYLTHELGHPCYERWTLTRIKQVWGSLGEAKTAKPQLLDLLLKHSVAIEWWESGRLRAAAELSAPSADEVLERLLRSNRRRFRAHETDHDGSSDTGQLDNWLAAIEPQRLAALSIWLKRGGRFINNDPFTNTLAVLDDAQATSLFLRDRASRSRHTLRAYAADLRRLISWCRDLALGPLSDLTRNDLLSYREYLRMTRANAMLNGGQRMVGASESSQARALAVVGSLYQYWFDTGYLIANPAVGLVAGTQAKREFSPKRFLPETALRACDAWVAQGTKNMAELAFQRRRAIWSLYRYGGIRLAELAWDVTTNLPRIMIEDDGQWTLYVDGKGNKPRAVPLPSVAIAAVAAYRSCRGLPAEPAAHEVLPLIHGLKGGSLKESGLYSEVKAIFEGVAQILSAEDPACAALLAAASPHWLRHAYAKTLVVDNQVPLPVAQALLGHASVQTTAGYAKTDLTQLRHFVQGTFNDKPR